MIGLARPLCAEPNLPFLLLTGKSTGAKENKVPALMQTPAAVLQIHCFAEGRPILELSSQDGAAEVVDMIMVRSCHPFDTEVGVSHALITLDARERRRRGRRLTSSIIQRCSQCDQNNAHWNTSSRRVVIKSKRRLTGRVVVSE